MIASAAEIANQGFHCIRDDGTILDDAWVIPGHGSAERPDPIPDEREDADPVQALVKWRERHKELLSKRTRCETYWHFFMAGWVVPRE